ncbi:MAG: AI-2E family transporter [Halorubrum sp.]
MNRGQAFLLLVFAVVSTLLYVVAAPFLEYVIFAVILGYVLYPAHRSLSTVLGERFSVRVGEFLSPLILILGSMVLLALPLAYVVSRFVRDLQAIARGESELQTELIEATIAEQFGVELNVVEGIELVGEALVGALVGDATGLLFTALDLALGAALVLFLVFYILRDGPKFVGWLRANTPLPGTVVDKLTEQIDKTTWGAVIGHGFAALVQAIVAGVGLYVVGIPNVFFWTFVMFILAFLPLIGAFLVWAPAAGYLYLIGDTVDGVFLAIYGLLIVSMIDYYVRPLVIDRRARLNPAVLLVGVFGGLYSMGFVGLFVGPITIGVFVATVRTIQEDYNEI